MFDFYAHKPSFCYMPNDKRDVILEAMKGSTFNETNIKKEIEKGIKSAEVQSVDLKSRKKQALAGMGTDKYLTQQTVILFDSGQRLTLDWVFLGDADVNKAKPFVYDGKVNTTPIPSRDIQPLTKGSNKLKSSDLTSSDMMDLKGILKVAEKMLKEEEEKYRKRMMKKRVEIKDEKKTSPRKTKSMKQQMESLQSQLEELKTETVKAQDNEKQFSTQVGIKQEQIAELKAREAELDNEYEDLLKEVGDSNVDVEQEDSTGDASSSKGTPININMGQFKSRFKDYLGDNNFYSRVEGKLYDAFSNGTPISAYKTDETKYGAIVMVVIDGEHLQLTKKKMRHKNITDLFEKRIF